MPRDAGLDAARAVLIVVVVTAHAAAAYMVTPLGWAIQDGSRHLAFDAYVFVAAAFLMPAFFWLSGYFAAAVYRRRGPAGYLRHRLTRLALPLAVALVPCSLALDALWDWGRALAGRATVAAEIPRLEGSTLPITLGHLWFLYYLLVLSLAALGVVELWRRLRLPAVPAAWIVPLAALVSTVVLAAAGVWHLDTPLGFGIDLRVAVYQAAFFGWGWAVHAHPGELVRYARRAWWALAISPVLLAAILPALDDRGGRAPRYAIAASGAATVALVIALLGLCVRHTRRLPAAIERLSAASYGIYIVHLPLVVLLQIACSRLSWPAPLEHAAISAITLAVCLAGYAALARARGSRAASRPPPGSPAPARSAHTP
ncbi:MAG TPA: acyltransferase family protein [Kofleriaceae bacterium]